MKSFRVIFLLLCLTAFGLEASAQASKPRKNAPYTMRDGATRKLGKLIVIKNGKEKPLTTTFTARNGTKVMPNGMVKYADGTEEKLAEGYAINMDGNKVIFADDMIAPNEIRKHQVKVTGKDATTISIMEKTKVVINDSTGRKAVRDTVRTQTMDQ